MIRYSLPATKLRSRPLCFIVLSAISFLVIPTISFGSYPATFLESSQSSGTAPEGIVQGDLNNDGNPDMLVSNTTNNGSVFAFLGNGDGTFQAPLSVQTLPSPKALSLADFNGDAKLDLAVVAGSKVQIFPGNGDGTFQTPSEITPSAPFGLTAGYVNNDQMSDLVVTNKTANNVSVYLGNGDGTFQTSTSYTVGTSPHTVVIEDLNGDAMPDLVVGQMRGIATLLGNGDGTFNTSTNLILNSFVTVYSIVADDFNRDGGKDLALVYGGYPGANNIQQLLGNGDGTFQTPINYSIAGSNYSLVNGDFNLDGYADILVSCYSLNKIFLFPGTVSGLFDPPLDAFAPAANYGFYSAMSGDWNDDRKPDFSVVQINLPSIGFLTNDSPFNWPARIINSPVPDSTWYPALKDMYDAAATGDVIWTKVFDFVENLDCNRDIEITIVGGYDETYSSVIGVTTIIGSLTVSRGTVVIKDGVVIK